MVRAPVLGLLVSAALVLPLAEAGVRAQDVRTFIMPEDDGYGVADCLSAGPQSGCGRIVADAWCESKGFASARTFGRDDAADVTGSVQPLTKPKAVPAATGVLTITCQN